MQTRHYQASSTTKREFWRRHLERQQASNLSQTTYCYREGLNVASFYYWKKRLLGAVLDAPTKLRFVPLVATQEVTSELEEEPAPKSVSYIRLHFQDVILELAEDFDVMRLLQIVRSLGGGESYVAN